MLVRYDHRINEPNINPFFHAFLIATAGSEELVVL